MYILRDSYYFTVSMFSKQQRDTIRELICFVSVMLYAILKRQRFALRSCEKVVNALTGKPLDSEECK